MSEPTQRIIESNGIRLNLVEQGKVRWCSCATVFLNPGIRGATSILDL